MIHGNLEGIRQSTLDELFKARFQRRLLCGALFRPLRARFQRVHARFHLPEFFVHRVQPRFHGGLQGAYLRQSRQGRWA